MSNKLTIRKRGNTFFKNVDSRVRKLDGELFNDSYWIECDEAGNTVDHDGNGFVDSRTLLCKIPDGHDDIDLSTLSDDCLELS